MTNLDKKNVNDLPIFGRDIEDDWSWDREEEEMREAARNLDFERAMELRDILFEMKSNL